MISGIAALLCVGGGLFSCTDEPGGANSSPTGGPIRSDDDLLVKVVKAKGEATRTKNTTDITGGFSHPSNVAITPDGVTAFVTNFGEDFVSAIDVATWTKDPNNIDVNTHPVALAITPDGRQDYVANFDSSPPSVSTIDVATRQSDPTDIPVPAGNPAAIAFTPPCRVPPPPPAPVVVVPTFTG